MLNIAITQKERAAENINTQDSESEEEEDLKYKDSDKVVRGARTLIFKC